MRKLRGIFIVLIIVMSLSAVSGVLAGNEIVDSGEDDRCWWWCPNPPQPQPCTTVNCVPDDGLLLDSNLGSEVIYPDGGLTVQPGVVIPDERYDEGQQPDTYWYNP